MSAKFALTICGPGFRAGSSARLHYHGWQSSLGPGTAFARRRQATVQGHNACARSPKPAQTSSAVRNLTLFAFSTENWARPKKEVSLLMDLMRHVMQNDLEELHRRQVRLRVIGDRTRFAEDIQAKMAECEAMNRCQYGAESERCGELWWPLGYFAGRTQNG